MDRSIFMEEQIRSVQRKISIYFICSNLMESFHPILTACIHHDLCSKDVRFQKDSGILYGSVHMGLRSEVHNHIRMLFLKDGENPFTVSNILFVKCEPRILKSLIQRMDIGSIRQRIDANHPPIRTLIQKQIEEV